VAAYLLTWKINTNGEAEKIPQIFPKTLLKKRYFFLFEAFIIPIFIQKEKSGSK